MVSRRLSGPMTMSAFLRSRTSVNKNILARGKGRRTLLRLIWSLCPMAFTVAPHLNLYRGQGRRLEAEVLFEPNPRHRAWCRSNHFRRAKPNRPTRIEGSNRLALGEHHEFWVLPPAGEQESIPSWGDLVLPRMLPFRTRSDQFQTKTHQRL